MAVEREKKLNPSMDLAFSSLQHALTVGHEFGFREPSTLVVGPENWFVARELIGGPGKPYSADSEINALNLFKIEKSYSIPYNSWYIEFGNGRVISEPPQ